MDANVSKDIKDTRADIESLKQMHAQAVKDGDLRELNRLDGEIADRQELVRKLQAKRKVSPSEPAGVPKGSFRDRALARAQWHEEQATVPAAMQHMVDTQHAYYNEFLRHPELRKMVATGKINDKTLADLYKNPDSRQQWIPNVVGLADTPENRGFLKSIVNPKTGAEATLEHIMRPAMEGARARGTSRLYSWYVDHLSEIYKDHPNWLKPDGSMDEDKVHGAAMSLAKHWTKNNTYQGSRTIADQVMGMMFPFSGAAMSMQKFFVSQIKAHPWLAGALYKAGVKAMDLKQNNQAEWHLPGPLSWFHMGGGDEIVLHPLEFSFIGSEGMGSIVPSLGPLAMPFEFLAQQNGAMNALLSQVPGWGDHLPNNALDLAWGWVPSQIQPLIKGGVEGVGAATGTDVTGVLPGEDTRRAEQVRADIAKGETPDISQVEKELAATNITQGVASAMVPMRPSVGDARQHLISRAEAEIIAGADPKKVAANPDYKDVLPYLAYRDPTTTLAQKDQLLSRFNWLLPYTVSYHETAGTSYTGPKPDTLADFTQMTKSGDEHLMGVGEQTQAVIDAKKISDGFQIYNNYVKQPRDTYLQANGVTTSDPGYQLWADQNIKPVMDMLKNEYKPWYDKYLSGGATAKANSAAISTMSVFTQLPMMSEFDTADSNKWRMVMQMVQNAQSDMLQIKEQGGGSADLQVRQQQFHDDLNQMFANDPNFLDELGVQYHWSGWTDFLTTNVNQQYRNWQNG